ncbi:MAG: HAMP domain-containing sensor histidine kinase [Bacteroidota bacterium]
MNFLRLIRNYFLPRGTKQAADDPRDQSIFVSVLLISAIADLLGIPLAVQIEAPTIVWVLLANGLICIGLAFLYRAGFDKHIIGHIFIAQHAISFCIQAWAQGGLISPANAAFFLLPAVAMLTLGKRSATFWLIASVMVIAGFYIYEGANGSPPGVDPSVRSYLFFSAIITTNITIFIILLVYENSKNKAIREAKQRHDKIERQNQQIQMQNEKLIELHQEVFEQKKLRDRFFAIIAHDLRGSVTSFKAISDVIAIHVENQEFDSLNEMMPDVDQTTQQLVRLLDNLLNWASQELREIPYHPEKVDLWKMISDLIEGLRALAVSKSVQITNEVEKELTLWADFNTTFTIFRNLIHNALKFTNAGGLIKVATFSRDGEVDITVTDTGIGMSPETLKTLFNLEDRSSTYGTQGEKGIGLGLRLVEEFTKLNNGRVTVESAPGVGTTFKITLPARQLEISEAP